MEKKYVIDTYRGKREVGPAEYAAFHIANVWEVDDKGETADRKAEKISGMLGRLMAGLLKKGFLTPRDFETILKEPE